MTSLIKDIQVPVKIRVDKDGTIHISAPSIDFEADYTVHLVGGVDNVERVQ